MEDDYDIVDNLTTIRRRRRVCKFCVQSNRLCSIRKILYENSEIFVQMKSLIIFSAFVLIANAEDVRLIDLDPPEAQQIIESKDTSLKYAPKIESNVPAVRYLGNEPHQVSEDIYLANQYHGQDGVGGYLYGYSVPDIAKTERKKPSGDLKGAYNYVNGQGQEIKVEYWDNGNGFHQVDNVPKILPKQIDDSPEVKRAKEEHARIWAEEAERNSKPIQNPYPSAKPGAYAGLGAGVGAGQQTYPATTNLGFGGQKGGFGGQHGGSQGGFGSGSGQGGFGGSKPSYGQGGAGQQGGFGSGSSGFGGGQGGAGQGGFGGSKPSYGQGGAGQQGGSGQGGFGGSKPSYGQGGTGQQGGFGSGSSGFGGSQGGFGGSQGGSGQSGSGSSGFGGSHGGAGQGGFGGSQGGAGQGGFGGAGQGSGSSGFGGSKPSYGQQGGFGGNQGQGSGSSGFGGAGQSGSGGFGFGGSKPSFGQQGGFGGSGQGQYGGGGHQGGFGGSGNAKPGFGGNYGGSHQGSSNNPNHIDYTGQYSENSQSYAKNPQNKNQEEEEEEQGPPKGFFYNIDYPVGIIVSKGGQQKRDSLSNVYSQNKQNFEQQLKGGAALHGAGSYPSYQVHA